MTKSEWAKNEVRIACKSEAPNRQKDEWDYGCSCYESALKAYLSLMEDEHSLFSFSVTANILKRLLESKPLTPIEDVPESWNNGILSKRDDGTVAYQCNRMSSLFKNVNSDGSINYTDVDRFYCRDVESGVTFTSGLERSILDSIYPITMPYYPPLGRYEFLVKELLTDRRNGDFDTKAIFTLKTPDGKIEQIDKYFKEGPNGWEEIDVTEYLERCKAHKLREELET